MKTPKRMYKCGVFIEDIEKAAESNEYIDPTNLYLMHYNRVPEPHLESETSLWCGGFVSPGKIFQL